MKVPSQPHPRRKRSRISGALIDTANRLLAELGSPTEICSLVAQVLAARPVRTAEILVGQELYKAAKTGERGFVVDAYPRFKLTKQALGPGLPGRGYLAAASKVMSFPDSPSGYLDVREIARRARDAGMLDTISPVPEYWMYMRMSEHPEIFRRDGLLAIGLMGWRRSAPASVASAAEGTAQRSRARASLGERIYERDLESLISERLGLLEDSLELLGRQYSTPVGRIDLLCRDGRGNLVVVELKSFGGRTAEIIDQITRYMGYVKTHVATAHQLVRGIIVAGKVEEALSYAVVAIPNLEVRTFDVSITPVPALGAPSARDGRQGGEEGKMPSSPLVRRRARTF